MTDFAGAGTASGGQLSRRGLLKASGLTAGLLTAGATVGAGSAAAAVTVQRGWRFCTYCRGLWWPGSGIRTCFGSTSGHNAGTWSYNVYGHDYSLALG